MDFFPDIAENDVFSITDMIDYDMKVGVDGGDNLLSGCEDMDININGSFGMPSDSLDLCNFDSKFDSLSWLHMPETVAVKEESILDDHNTDELLVNPQTGLPVPVAIVLPLPAVSTSITQTQLPQSFQMGSSVVSSSNNNSFAGRWVMKDNSSQQEQQPQWRHTKAVEHLVYQQNQRNASFSQSTPAKVPVAAVSNQPNGDPASSHPKPVYSYSCLIAMALKNSETGALPVNEIYNFILENFPFFKTAPDGWKNSVRHNLSLNKCFEKVDNPKMAGSSSKKGCLWGLNPTKVDKMDEEIVKWRKKDPEAVKRSLSNPDMLEMLEKGLVGCRPVPQATSSSTPNIFLGSSSGASQSNNASKVVGKAVAILPKDVIEIKPVKHIGVTPELLGGIQKFDNVFADLSGSSLNWDTLNMGLLQTDTTALSHVLSNGGVGAGATLVALVPTAVNVGALLDANSSSVLAPQSHLLAARTIPTLS